MLNREDGTPIFNNNSRLPKNIWAIFAFSGVIVVGYIDYLTGNQLLLSVFYLLPISLAALKIGTRMTLIVAVTSAGVESIVHIWAEGFYGSSILVHFWNTGILLIIYIYIAVLVSSLRKAHQRERESARKDCLTLKDLLVTVFGLEPPKTAFDAESPIKIVEAKDLVWHNTGPLTELENLDKG